MNKINQIENDYKNQLNEEDKQLQEQFAITNKVQFAF